MRVDFLQHRFVDYIPERLEEGMLYVSMEYQTVAHKCCCGCGEEVSITLSPTDWYLIFDGKTISIEPSIGSWNLPCHSHYFITRNQVRWAPQWTPAQINAGRSFDVARKIEQKELQIALTIAEAVPLQSKDPKVGSGFWHWLKHWWT